SALVSLTAIAQIATQTGQGLKTGLGATWNNLKHLGDSDWKKDEGGSENDANIAAIIAQHDADQRKLTETAQSMYASIEGNSNQDIPNVPGRDTRTLADLKAEFSERLAETKRLYDGQKEIINEAISAKTISHQAAAPKIIAVVSAEEQAIGNLSTEYKQLAGTIGQLNGKTPADIKKAQ